MQHRVGEDVVNFCGKCKQRTYHVIFAMDGAKVKRVQCKVCLGYHNFHPDPTSDEPSGEPSGSSVRRRREGPDSEEVTPKSTKPPSSVAGTKKPRRSPKKSAEDQEATWEALWAQALRGKDLEAAINYDPTLDYAQDVLINHPSFGVGVVTQVNPVPEKKMHVMFQSGPKTLLCRYKVKTATLAS